MRKIILVLVCTLALTLVACGKKDAEKPKPAKQEAAEVKTKETLPTPAEMADKVEEARQEEKAAEEEAATENAAAEQKK